MDFLDKIDLYCREHNIRPCRFEKEAGLSKGLISKWRHTGARPGYVSRRRIAAYMNITADDLMRDIPVSPDSADISRDAVIRYIPVYRSVPDLSRPSAEQAVTYLPVIPGSPASAGNCYGLIVSGSGMAPDIAPGDIIIVRRDPNPDSGDIILAEVGENRAVCRRLYRTGDGIILEPASTRFRPLWFSREEIRDLPVVSAGSVIGLLRIIGNSPGTV